MFYAQWFTFVGTDISVYYEVAARWAQDGYLRLGINYWDHKPPLIFALLAPFTLLDEIVGESWGVKVGGFVLYSALVFAFYASARRHDSKCSGVPAALAACALAFATQGVLDSAQNGITMLLALVAVFSGLCLVLPNSFEDKPRPVLICLGGLLIGMAPFFRPTALTGFVVLTLLIVWKKWRNEKTLSLSQAWLYSVATGLLLGVATIGITGFEEGLRTLVQYNVNYSTHFREQISVFDFFNQKHTAQIVSSLSLTLLIIFYLRLHGGGESKNDITRMITLWIVLEILSSIMQRKLQSFYTFSFMLPLLGAACLIVSSTRSVRFRKFGNVILGIAALYTFIELVLTLQMEVFSNDFITQRNQMPYGNPPTS